MLYCFCGLIDKVMSISEKNQRESLLSLYKVKKRGKKNDSKMDKYPWTKLEVIP